MIEKKVEILSGRPLIEGISSTLNDVNDIISRVAENSCIAHGSIISSIEASLGLSARPGLNRLVVDLIRESIDNADRSAGADPVATATLTTGLLRALMCSIAAGETAAVVQRDIDTTITFLRKRLLDAIRRPRFENIEAIISATLHNDTEMFTLLVEALNIAGLDGRLFFELAKIPEPQIELRTGYCFDTVKPVMSSIGKQLWEAHDVRIACIDGFIESVAEIDQLLTVANESREPLVIFARQFADEVLHTLSVNLKRGTLNVVPVVVPFDADSANILKDIAVVAGGDVISSLEGRLISSINFDELTTVTHVQLRPNNTVINESSTSSNVAMQVNHLRTKMSDDAIAAPFLMRRARSLTARTVFVRMPDSGLVRAARVDRALKQVRSAIISGIVTRNHLLEAITADSVCVKLRAPLKAWYDTFSNKTQPVQALDSMLVNAAANSKLLATTGAVLI